MKTQSKEELQKQLAKIQEQERKEFTNKHWPEFQKLIGKCFRYRNSYGTGKDWWLYIKVTNINKSSIYPVHGGSPSARYDGFSFQVDYYGNIQIEKERNGYVHSLGKEITQAEFTKAFNSVKKKINSLK
jgi:hypothetical protein